MNETAKLDDYGGLFTVEEARVALRCSRGTVYSLARRKQLEMVKIGKAITRVTGRSLNKLLQPATLKE